MIFEFSECEELLGYKFKDSSLFVQCFTHSSYTNENFGAKNNERLEFFGDKIIDVEAIVKGIQPIAFENAVWAYTVGTAIAIKTGCTKAKDAAKKIGVGLQSFCVPGSVAEQRKVGLGHGNLASMLYRKKLNVSVS